VPLLIDGHNVIGAGVFPDIRLSDEHDEVLLIARLKVWKSRYKGKITVIFDRGIPGGKDKKLGGAGVEVIFAASPQQADDLIRRRIRGKAPNLVVVTNDEALRREARIHQVETWSALELVERLSAPQLQEDEPGTEARIEMSATEVESWLNLFTRANPGKASGATAGSSKGRRPKPSSANRKRKQGNRGTKKRKNKGKKRSGRK
jgi:predicted RNA-binding protein with PIN domain